MDPNIDIDGSKSFVDETMELLDELNAACEEIKQAIMRTTSRLVKQLLLALLDELEKRIKKSEQRLRELTN